MYFGVKLRDFEGFLIPVRKTPRQLNFCKFTNKSDRGLRGGPEFFLCCQMVLVVKL